eukprot:4395431-Prymnesium_polylepis.2
MGTRTTARSCRRVHRGPSHSAGLEVVAVGGNAGDGGVGGHGGPGGGRGGCGDDGGAGGAAGSG